MWYVHVHVLMIKMQHASVFCRYMIAWLVVNRNKSVTNNFVRSANDHFGMLVCITVIMIKLVTVYY